MAKQPHIIIFNPDEMRGDALAHLGNPASITPNLDAFAAHEAVSFGQAYCQNPVCVPSRCSFFTGLYPHVRGHRTMSHLLRPGETSMLKELKEAGYYVWMNDRNDLTAGQIPGWTESHATEIYYSGQKKQGPGNVNPGQRGEPGNKYYYSHYEGQLKCNAEGKNYNGDDEVVDAAIERIHNRPADQPLCMFLGLIYPHTPYRVEEPYFSAIDRAKLPKRVHADDCTGKPLMESEIRKYAGMQDFTDADWDELRAVYLGMCMKIDVQFGKLVEALKEEGVAGAVVTHGTDTVEETAYMLDILHKSEKPIVLTAAMRGAGDTSPDGPANIYCAVKTAASEEAKGKGVMVLLNEIIHAAGQVRKTHSANPDTFASPWWGPIGYCDVDRVVFRRTPLDRHTYSPKELTARVDIVTGQTGIGRDYIDFAVAQGCKGIVLEGFGRGNLPAIVEPAIKDATDKGVVVVITTRTPGGRPYQVYAYPGSVTDSRNNGAIHGGEFSSAKTRLKLMVLLSERPELAKKENREELERLLDV